MTIRSKDDNRTSTESSFASAPSEDQLNTTNTSDYYHSAHADNDFNSIPLVHAHTVELLDDQPPTQAFSNQSSTTASIPVAYSTGKPPSLPSSPPPTSVQNRHRNNNNNNDDDNNNTCGGWSCCGITCAIITAIFLCCILPFIIAAFVIGHAAHTVLTEMDDEIWDLDDDYWEIDDNYN